MEPKTVNCNPKPEKVYAWLRVSEGKKRLRNRVPNMNSNIILSFCIDPQNGTPILNVY